LQITSCNLTDEQSWKNETMLLQPCSQQLNGNVRERSKHFLAVNHVGDYADSNRLAIGTTVLGSRAQTLVVRIENVTEYSSHFGPVENLRSVKCISTL
jgi:hypothetical protein